MKLLAAREEVALSNDKYGYGKTLLDKYRHVVTSISISLSGIEQQGRNSSSSI